MLNQPGRAMRVLVVDDEATLLFFLKQELKEANPAAMVEIASSGEDAMSKLAQQSYDLLITDLQMAGVDGFRLIETARALHPDIKVILMTAFGSREVYEEARRRAVDGYLTKPFPTAQLKTMALDMLAGVRNSA